ncbi:MAG: hypothetical protein AAF591_04985 [Verrucomicrobiota bacterium]
MRSAILFIWLITASFGFAQKIDWTGEEGIAGKDFDEISVAFKKLAASSNPESFIEPLKQKDYEVLKAYSEPNVDLKILRRGNRIIFGPSNLLMDSEFLLIKIWPDGTDEPRGGMIRSSRMSLSNELHAWDDEWSDWQFVACKITWVPAEVAGSRERSGRGMIKWGVSKSVPADFSGNVRIHVEHGKEMPAEEREKLNLLVPWN